MKVSKFTSFSVQKPQILLFNSLTNKKAAVPYSEELWLRLKDSTPFETDCAIIKKLYDMGFFVDVDRHETEIAELKKLNYVSDNMLFFTMIPTMNCNFSCLYCYEKKTPAVMGQDTLAKIKKYLSKHLREYQGLCIEWFGGEPLMCLSCIEELNGFAVDLCKKLKKVFASTITTNGYLLSKDIVKRLLNVKVTDFQITLDGTAKRHNLLRPLKGGGDTYQKIICNLIQMKESPNYFKVLLRSNVSQESMADLPAFLSEMEMYFKDDERFDIVIKAIGDWGGESVKSMSKDLLQSNDSIYTILNTYGKGFKFDQQFPLLSNNSICYANKLNSYVINYDGAIMKCTVKLMDEMNKIGSFHSSGEMVLNPEKTAYWVSRENEDREQCRQCPCYANCFGKRCPIIDNQYKNCECSGERLGIHLQAQYKIAPSLFTVLE